MHLHRLEFRALGPFPGQHAIDFDALGSTALFLIDGPTGVGKSSIIDAIAFALYGGVAGEHSDDQRLHSSFAPPDDEPWAMLEFSTSSGRFRVRRTPRYVRPKKRGSGDIEVNASVLLERSVGPSSWEFVTRSIPEAATEIERALGLSRAQFLQTVVLPQGEFAAFLAADSSDRLAVLQRIFATSAYAEVERLLDDRRRAAEAQRAEAVAAVERAVAHVIGRLADDDPARQEAPGPGMPDEAVLADLDALVLATRQRHQDAVAQSDTADAAAAGSAGRLAEAERVRGVRERQAAAASALDAAEAALAEARSGLAEHEAVIASLGAGPDDPGALADAVQRATGALGPALEAEASLPAERAARERLSQRVVALEERLAGLTKERDEGLPDRLGDLAASAALAAAAAEGQAQDARRAEAQAIRARLDGMAADLAAGLVDGEPCPVCGAREHPHPAPAAERQVSAADVESAGLARSTADEQVHRVRVERVRLGSHPEAGFQQPRLAGAAQRSLGELSAGIGELLARQAALAATLASAVDQRAVARAARDAQAAVVRERGAVVAAALSGYATVAGRAAALAGLESALLGMTRAAREAERAAAALATAAADAAGLPAAVDDSTRDALAVQAREAEAHARRVAGTRDSAASLAADLAARLAAVRVAMADRDACRARTDDVITVAQVVRGGVGNRLAQPLSAYVVQAMFDEVLGSANRRLAAMLDGRFELHATEERTGRKLMGQGLGLEVLDLRTETLRKASTLSGGETFCAALALALGLADTVRANAGGIEIGTLLIDEGFGSLDPDRLDDVMAELQRLRKDGRVVGVISHVSEMKRGIAERIDVRPIGPRDGSTLEVSWQA